MDKKLELTMLIVAVMCLTFVTVSARDSLNCDCLYNECARKYTFILTLSLSYHYECLYGECTHKLHTLILILLPA